MYPVSASTSFRRGLGGRESERVISRSPPSRAAGQGRSAVEAMRRTVKDGDMSKETRASENTTHGTTIVTNSRRARKETSGLGIGGLRSRGDGGRESEDWTGSIRKRW